MEPVKSTNAPPGQASPASADFVPVQQFIGSLSASELLAAEEVQAFLAGLEPAQRQDTRLLAQELVKQGQLTRYQAQMLCQGRTKGLVLGNYVILDKVGQGGMGMVFKARHRRMKRVVALKVLPPAITKNPTAVQRFQREAEAAAKLNHPNIVAAYDADEAQGVHFLVMEFVDGVDLAQLVKKQGALPIDQAVQCILQAARGLAHAHAAGIIHRDIKPHNLLLASAIGYRPSAIGQQSCAPGPIADGRQPIAAPGPMAEGRQPIAVVKILDMGLARIEGAANAPGQAGAAELTQSGSIMGTCDYMAPEQAMNTKRADQRADIYSLGCTLYFLLTARTTYGGETAMEKLMAHQQDPIPSLLQARPDVPQKLEAIYQKMLAKKPEDRYQSMTAVIADLEGLGYRPSAVGPRPSALGYRPEAGAAELTADSPRPAALGESHSDLEKRTVAASKSMLFSVGMGARLRGKGKWLAAAILGLVVLLLLGWAIFRVDTSEGTFIIETDDPQIAVMLDKAGGVIVHDQKTQRKFTLKGSQHRLPTGDYELEVADSSGLAFNTRIFTIKRGESTIVRARFEKAAVGQRPPEKKGLEKKGVDDAWIKSVQALPPDKQVEAVAAKLKELNPGFDGKVEHNVLVAMGKVIGLKFVTDQVNDISPVKALTGLQTLHCDGSGPQKGSLADLTPLKGMALTTLSFQNTLVNDLKPLKGMPLISLHFNNTPIDDLTPLQGMPLTYLRFNSTKVTDLTPLKRMPLTRLSFSATPVADLTPLQGMQLTFLSFPQTKVANLTPLKGMPLTNLELSSTPVADLTPLQGLPLTRLLFQTTKVTDLKPLKGLPLKVLYCPFQPERDGKILRAIKTLEEINGKPAAEFWKEVEAQGGGFEQWLKDVQKLPPEKQVEAIVAKLKELNPGFRGALKPFIKDGVAVTGLTFAADPAVTDIAPLRALPALLSLTIRQTQVSSLAPLAGLQLSYLDCRQTRVTDFAILQTMPLQYLYADLRPERDAVILKAIKTLRQINDQPAAAFWKEVEGKKP